MKKIIKCLSIFTLGFILIITPVMAESDNSNSANGTSNSTTAAEAKEKRVTIKEQAQELAELRLQIRNKISEKKEIMNQYRNESSLSDEQITEIKAMIQTMEQVQEKLQNIYQNANQALTQYKGDTSTDKLTGLDAVITSQQERIASYEEILTDLS